MEILDGVLEEFQKLAAIPRKSGEEKRVSDFLKTYLTEQGFHVVQDEVNNIIADAPATPGFEQAPRTILQGHMDMVCVAEDGYAYDPLRDPIKLVRSEKYLEAEGTSLGADDGIGVAEGLYLLKHAKDHGPLRLIVTVDEERGMTGAIHLAPKYLQDAKFLINCDSENYDELTVGSAGSVDLTFRRALKYEAAPEGKAYRLSVGGLLGGHSGERIGDGRGNALRTLAFLLQALSRQGRIALADLHGGKAHNAIPDTAEACFLTQIPREEISQILTAEKEKFLAIYGAVDPSVEFVLQETEAPERVLIPGDAQRLLRLLLLLHTGVFAMSTVIPSLVETSANLGVVRMEDDVVSVEYFPRSAIDGKLDEFAAEARILGDLVGFEAVVGTKSPGWKENKKSVLAKMMAEVFEEQNGKPMKVETIHAGLECGWHFGKNPQLDMVSIGVTTQDIHSPNERLVLATVEPQVRLIEEALRRIARL